MIELNKGYYPEILGILKKNVPQCEVLAFGSRYYGTEKDYSDLDLAIVGEEPAGDLVIDRMRDEFAESDIPFRVDILNLNTVSPEFRKIIEKGYKVIQMPAAK